jgi:2-polyprenyl-3-methyl-5-hydroxy-6-metoxy-1,4-benzoquinol methylase
MPRTEQWLAANRAMWDERVPIHTKSRFYDVDGFLAGKETLRSFELAEAGPVEGKTLVHLQCHFGLDTLSWARHGARVSGLDFSEPAIAAARKLAAQAGVEAAFVCSDVYAAPEAFAGRQFDLVYTGLGALTWLPDITAWAEAVASLVKPGGFLYLAEFHPVADIFADAELTAAYDYFHTEAKVWDEPGTYADGDQATKNNLSYEWTHPIGEVVTALIDVGLRLEFLHEHGYTLYARWPFLEHAEGTDEYRLPTGTPALPLMYSLKASK